MNPDGTTQVSPFDEIGFDFRSPPGFPKQAYMWIFNDLDEDADPGWALVTDSTWVFPQIVNTEDSASWRTGATTTAVYGSFTDGSTFNTFQTATVPEPSTPVLGLIGFFLLVLMSRR